MKKKISIFYTFPIDKLGIKIYNNSCNPSEKLGNVKKRDDFMSSDCSDMECCMYINMNRSNYKKIRRNLK